MGNHASANIIIALILIVAVYHIGKASNKTPVLPTVTEIETPECRNYLNDFENRMKAEYLTYGNAKLTKFIVGYSPSLKTCVAGFTAQHESINTELFGNEYSLHIYDLNTNVLIKSFDIMTEIISRADEFENVPSDVKYRALQQYVWEDYAKELKELTNGQVNILHK